MEPTLPARPRLRELRMDRGWTQQEVADRLCQLAWTRSAGTQVAVTGDMVAKWERGKKRPVPRYRQLLADLFRVDVADLGFGGSPTEVRHRDESLVGRLDAAARLLNELGNPGRALRPQVLAALTEDALTRRSVLAMLDQTPLPPRSTPAASAADLEALAQQCEAAYDTAPPAALLTAVSAQLRIATDAVHSGQSTGTCQRILRARIRLAILAGRLAGDDIGNVMAARAYFAQATDDALDLGDHALTAIAAGYTAQLAIRQGQPTAAVAHLSTAATLAITDPTIRSWLASLEAVACADDGDHAAARTALDCARKALATPARACGVPWFHDHDAARQAAITGHVELKADDPGAAEQLAAAADQLRRLGSAARRSLVLCLVDQATAELRTGSAATAFAAADWAADLMQRMPYAAGIARLGHFRDAFAPRAHDGEALRRLDDRLAQLAA